MGEPAASRGSETVAAERASSIGVHALIGVATVAAALLALALSPSCTLDRMGQKGSGGGGGGVQGEECREAADCPGLFLDCRQPSCVGGLCDTAYVEAGGDCDDDGGKVCDGRGECVECIDHPHCAPGEICQLNLCVPASCGDGTLNGDETDLDCGGSCAPCENGKKCYEKTDCLSGYCTTAGTGELGVCAPCSVSQDCLATHYCDNGTCVERSDNGDNCTSDEQCLSGFCPEQDEACCDQACDELCEACIPGFTNLGPGQCGPVVDGTPDYEGECPDEGAASCGSNGTGCNGLGACHLYPADTQCGGGVCVSDDEHRPDLCDGAGSCVDGGIDPCSPYHCVSGVCLTVCQAHTDCRTGSYCESPPNGSCLSQGGQGDPCGDHPECDTGYCIDGYCCESDCDGTCESCDGAYNVMGAPAGNGYCRDVRLNEDPRGDCTHECDGNGNCEGAIGDGCPSPYPVCNSTFCVDGYCCDEACTGNCKSCAGSETPAGSDNGECDYVVRNRDPDGDCKDPAACDGSGYCEGNIGEACPVPFPICDSDFCEDGYCCDEACGTCKDCGEVGHEGDCLNMLPFSPDGSACADPNRCDGDGNCVPFCGLEPTPAGSCPNPACTGGCTAGVCTILCDDDGECDGTGGINCPNGYECRVQCTGTQSCQGNTINCPWNLPCVVTCNGDQACQGTKIDCSTRGTCSLSCGETGTPPGHDCDGAVLDCGNNDCSASCTGTTIPPTVNCTGTAGCTCSGC